MRDDYQKLAKESCVLLSVCSLFLRLGFGLGVVLLKKRNASAHQHCPVKKDGLGETTFSWNHSLFSPLLKTV